MFKFLLLITIAINLSAQAGNLKKILSCSLFFNSSFDFSSNKVSESGLEILEILKQQPNAFVADLKTHIASRADSLNQADFQAIMTSSPIQDLTGAHSILKESYRYLQGYKYLEATRRIQHIIASPNFINQNFSRLNSFIHSFVPGKINKAEALSMMILYRPELIQDQKVLLSLLKTIQNLDASNYEALIKTLGFMYAHDISKDWFLKLEIGMLQLADLVPSYYVKKDLAESFFRVDSFPFYSIEESSFFRSFLNEKGFYKKIHYPLGETI